jgi:hypothetical protein
MSIIIENIEKRAKFEHGGDFTKAATAYFQDHPDHYPDYVAKVSNIGKQAAEKDPAEVNAFFNLQVDRIALRDGLNLGKPDDRLQAMQKVAAELPDLYHRVRKASTVQVGKAHR